MADGAAPRRRSRPRRRLSLSSRSPSPRAGAPEPEPEPVEPEPEPEPVEPEPPEPLRGGGAEPDSEPIPTSPRHLPGRGGEQPPPGGDTPAGLEAVDEAEEEEPHRTSRRRRRRARGHARLPPGDAGARPALVRAEAAARLRLRLDVRSRRRAPQRKLRRGSPAPATPALMQLSGVPCRFVRRNPPCRRESLVGRVLPKPEILCPGLNARPVRRCSRGRWPPPPPVRFPARRPPRAAMCRSRASARTPRGRPCA